MAKIAQRLDRGGVHERVGSRAWDQDERRDAATKSGLKNTAIATNAAAQSIPLIEPPAVQNLQRNVMFETI